MATPSWDVLHTRLAVAVRDGVSSASTNGGELTVADRDAYLNYAYSKFVGLVAQYNPEAVEYYLPELRNVVNASIVSGVITLPDDFGYFISLAGNGILVEKLDADKWINMKENNSLVTNAPSATMIYILVTGDRILTIPVSISTPVTLAYMIRASQISQGGAADIPVKSRYFDAIISLAKAQYLRDKEEYEAAKVCEDDAIISSPVKIGVPKK